MRETVLAGHEDDRGVEDLSEQDLGQIGPDARYRQTEVLQLVHSDSDSEHDEDTPAEKQQRKRVTIIDDPSEDSRHSFDSENDTDGAPSENTPNTIPDAVLDTATLARKRSHLHARQPDHLGDGSDAEEDQPDWDRIMPTRGAAGLHSESNDNVALREVSSNQSQ